MPDVAAARRKLELLTEVEALRARKKALLAQIEVGRFGAYRDRPVEFMREVLGQNPWAKPVEISRALVEDKRVVVSSCFASAKTFTAGALVAWWVSTDPGAIAITTASVGRQVSGQLWGEIRKLWRKGITLPGQIDSALMTGLIKSPSTVNPVTGYKLPGGLLPKAPEWMITPGENFAIGFSTNDPNKFAGWHSDRVLVVLDEAEGVPDDLWDIMEGQLSTGDVAVLALGNPDPEGRLGGFQRAAQSARWRHISISAFETPNLVGGRDDIAPYLVTGRWVEEMRQEWGEDHPLWITKVLGQFVEGGSAKNVVPLAFFVRAVDRPGVVPVASEPVAGLDIARFGRDNSAIAVRSGATVLHLEKIHGADGPSVGGWAIERMRRHGCTRVYGDSTGLGGPVLDFMRLTPGISVIDVNAGEKPSVDVREKFARKRDELWWVLRDRFERDAIVLSTKVLGAATINDLKAQVTPVLYRFDIAGRIVVESKESMASRGLPSPDLGDALCLASQGGAPARSNAALLLNTEV